MYNINLLKQIYRDGFNDSDLFVDFFFKKLVREENIITYEESGKIISAGYIMEKPAFLFGKRTVLPYLSALSTLKEYRGQGKIRNIIEKAYQILFEREFIFTALYPFNYEYYKRYSCTGISYCSDDEIKGGIKFNARQADEKDYNSIINIYSEMSKKYDNRLILDENTLKLKIEEYRTDNIECVILSDSQDFAFAFSENGIINFYGTIDLNKFRQAENFKGCKFYDFSAFERNFLQGRIINAEKALLSYPYDKNLKIKLKIGIIDAEIKDNNIVGELEIENGAAQLNPLKSTPDMVFSIQKLTEIMFNGDNFLFKSLKNFLPDKY